MAFLNEIPFWQSEWQGIKFKEVGTSLSETNLPSSNFYNAFYLKLFSTYNDFDSLPKKWRINKLLTAEILSALIVKKLGKTKVLLYGCGIGFLEYCLQSLRDDLDLYSYDFADLASKWILGLNGIKFNSNELKEKDFDVIYLCQVLNGLRDTEVQDLLFKLNPLLVPGGRLVLVNTSSIPRENGFTPTFQARLRVYKDVLFAFYKKIHPKESGANQFWGWHRSNSYYKKVCNSAGFKCANVLSGSQQSFMVFEKNQLLHE